MIGHDVFTTVGYVAGAGAPIPEAINTLLFTCPWAVKAYTFSSMKERLTLEPLRPEHADEMVAVLGDPALYEMTGGEPPTLDELRERYERQAAGRSPDGSADWLNWIARTIDDGQAVGFVQATVVDGRADVAWLIGTPWQRRGYATEAARKMVALLEKRGVREITAHIRADHSASVRVATKLGLSPTNEVEEGEIVWRRL